MLADSRAVVAVTGLMRRGAGRMRRTVRGPYTRA